MFRRPSAFAPLLTSAFLVALALLGGCSSPVQTTQKDLNALQPGTLRGIVIDEFGTPASSTLSRAGLPVDVFTFVQGTAPANKTPRPVEPEQAEAAEWMALLEHSGHSPTALLAGKKITVQVNYDALGRVTDTVLLRLE